MKKANMRVLALLLAAMLVSGMLPASAWAADATAPRTEVTESAEAPEERMSLDVTVPSETVPPEDVTLPAETATPDATAEAPDPAVLEAPTELPTEAIKPTEGELQAEPKIDGPVPEGLMPMSADNYIWFQGYVYRVDESAPNYKRTYTLKDGTHTIDLDHLYVMRLKVNGSWKVAYCLEPDTATHAGVDYGDGSNTGVSGDWKVNLTRDQQTAIGLVMLYSAQHHPDTLSSTEGVEWEVATQIIIWEIVMGMRNPTQPYACTDSSLINQFDSTSKGVRYNDGSNYYLKGIRAKYNTLSSEMALHGVIPSFTKRNPNVAPIHTMQRQANGSYTLTLTDTNGVLGSYKFSSQSPLTLSQSGNTLTATAPSGASWSEMTFSASRNMLNPENPACLFRIFYLDAHNQALASPPDKASIPSDPVPAYFKVKEGVTPGTASMRKTSDSGLVDGYCFKMWQANGNQTYYGKSDSDGNIYVTNSSYAATGTRSYTFSGLLDGEFSFREALSVSDHQSSHPVSWRFVVTDRNGKVTVDRTLTESEITADGGDFITPRIPLTGLTGGGKLTMTVVNAPNTATLEIRKTSDDGKVSGITFTLEEWVPGIGYCSIGKHTTDSTGKIQIPNLVVGTKYRVVETVPEGYEAEQESQEITIQARSNQLTFVNHRSLEDLEIIKTSDDGKVSGITFTLEEWVPGIGYCRIGKHTTDSTGKIQIPNLVVGTKYRVIETVPEGYEAEQESQEITIQAGSNVLQFVNRYLLRDLEIIKTSTDGKVAGIAFAVTDVSGNLVGSGITDAKGKLTIAGLRIGNTYRVTETVPEGYISEKPVQTVTIRSGTNTVTFQNRPVFGNVELSKVDESDPKVKLSGAEFTVTKPNGAKVRMEEILDRAGKGTGVYRLEDLPYGRYTVQETKAPEGYELNQAIFEVNITEEKTYVVQADGFEGIPNRQQVGSLTVHKVDLENRPLSGVTFLLEYSQDGENWKPVVFREEHSIIAPGGCTSQGLKDGALTTGEDGMAVFSGLAITIGQRHIQYRLTETATLEGDTLLAEPVFAGELPDEGTRDVTITAVNTSAFTMPFTGSIGFTAVPLGVVLMLLALSTAVFLGRKKKKAT